MANGRRVVAIAVAASAAVAASLLLVTRDGDGGRRAPYDTAQEVVDALDDNGVACTGFAPDAPGELFTLDQGTCTVDGNPVVVRTFTDGEAQRQWNAAAAASGGIHVEGDRWNVSPRRQYVAERVRDAIGGAIRYVPPGAPTPPESSAPASAAGHVRR